MKFIDIVPKDNDGNIILSPCASYINAEQKEILIDGTVDLQWFQTNFSNIANVECPLPELVFNDLKAIGKYWSLNADVWRQQGLV